MEEGRSLGVSRLKVGLIAVLLVCCIVAVLVFLSLNSRPVQDNVVPSRLDSIPVGAVKVVPDVARASLLPNSDFNRFYSTTILPSKHRDT